MSQSSNPVVGQATEQEKNVGSVVIRGVLDAEAGERVTAFICANASNATPEATAAGTAESAAGPGERHPE